MGILSKLFQSLDARCDEAVARAQRELEKAIIEANSVMAEHLLEQTFTKSDARIFKLNPNASPSTESSFLHMVAFRNNARIAKALIKAGASVDFCDNSGLTPLHTAARFNTTEVAMVLLDSGANINAQSSEGLTPLHRAVIFNKTNMLELLLERGARRDICDNEGSTPRFLAVSRKLSHLADLLNDAPAPATVKAPTKTPVHGPDAPQGNNEWEMVDAKSITRTRHIKSAGMTMVELFDFAARERITTTVFSGNVSTPDRRSFNHINDKAPLDEACQKLIALGGTPDPETVHAPPRSKEPLFRPDHP